MNTSGSIGNLPFPFYCSYSWDKPELVPKPEVINSVRLISVALFWVMVELLICWES